MANHQMVELDGLRLAYRVSGSEDGPPLLLLHALGEQGADWAEVTPAFADHHRVYAPDLRGHGASDWPGAYSLDLMAHDVVGLLDALRLDQVDLIGHSMGGVVAYLLAARHPERVGRLVLEDAPAPLPRPRTVPVRPEGELDFDWEMALALRAEIDDPDPAWPALLGRITAPTLVVAGGPRSHLPQERQALLAEHIPDARLTTIDAGHLVHEAEPEAFTAAVLAFLAEG